MTFVMRSPLLALVVALSMATVAAAQTSDSLPTTTDVITKMIAFNARRQSELSGYTARRLYKAVDGKHHAEMLVGVACANDGSERFSVLSESGSGWIRGHVFRRLLKEESEASRSGTRESTRITPENYKFRMIGQETLDTGPAYVLAVIPRTGSKYLIDGRIWIDASDYSIVRVEGRPARNPSFWVRSINVVRTYQRVGPFWLAALTDTISQIRIFGRSELTIENFDYTLDISKRAAVNLSGTIR